MKYKANLQLLSDRLGIVVKDYNGKNIIKPKELSHKQIDKANDYIYWNKNCDKLITNYIRDIARINKSIIKIQKEVRFADVEALPFIKEALKKEESKKEKIHDDYLDEINYMLRNQSAKVKLDRRDLEEVFKIIEKDNVKKTSLGLHRFKRKNRKLKDIVIDSINSFLYFIKVVKDTILNKHKTNYIGVLRKKSHYNENLKAYQKKYKVVISDGFVMRSSRVDRYGKNIWERISSYDVYLFEKKKIVKWLPITYYIERNYDSWSETPFNDVGMTRMVNRSLRPIYNNRFSQKEPREDNHLDNLKWRLKYKNRW